MQVVDEDFVSCVVERKDDATHRAIIYLQFARRQLEELRDTILSGPVASADKHANCIAQHRRAQLALTSA